MTAAGIDPEAAQQSGQLELRTNAEVYLPDGRFDQDRMLRVFEQLATRNTTYKIPPDGYIIEVGQSTDLTYG